MWPMTKRLLHYFVVYGERHADGTVEFWVDDESLMSRFDNSAIYDPNTDEWLPRSALRGDDELFDEDFEISEALGELLSATVRTHNEESSEVDN